MAEKSCRPAFSLPFHGLIVARQVDFSNEVPDQFDFLPAMAAGFVRRMDDNFLYKLIDNGGRQFANAHIFPYNGCKAVKVGFRFVSGSTAQLLHLVIFSISGTGVRVRVPNEKKCSCSRKIYGGTSTGLGFERTASTASVCTLAEKRCLPYRSGLLISKHIRCGHTPEK